MEMWSGDLHQGDNIRCNKFIQRTLNLFFSGVLSSSTGTDFQNFVTDNIHNNVTAVQNCFTRPNVVIMDVTNDLEIRRYGWTEIPEKMQERESRLTLIKITEMSHIPGTDLGQ